MKQKIAIIGSGISGLAASYYLRHDFEIHLFEANDYFGGHTHTVDINLNSESLENSENSNQSFGVDTGFLVFNHQTYPNLCALFEELNVETVPSNMSFSTSITRKTGEFIEWSGNNLNTVFSQRKNILNPAFWGMLLDIIRFNKAAKKLVESINDKDNHNHEITLEEFIKPFGVYFKEHYLVPMAAAVWSCPMEDILTFPAQSFLRFCYNHGLLNIINRPQWYTVKGGAKHYVNKIIDAIHEAGGKTYLNEKVDKLEWLPQTDIINGSCKIAVHRLNEIKLVDYVVFACHSPQSLKILEQNNPLASDLESYQNMLQSVSYQMNKVYLHTDERLMPQNKKAWAAWNYLENQQNTTEKLCSLTYWINTLQPLPTDSPVLVTLNPSLSQLPDVSKTYGVYDYAHPVFSQKSYAQRENSELQGKHGLYFCGAWLGYGFHEDGLSSALRVVDYLKS